MIQSLIKAMALCLVAKLLLVGCLGDIEEPVPEDQECDPGSEGCECYGNQTCDSDLICVEAICAAPPESLDAGPTELDTAATEESDTTEPEPSPQAPDTEVPEPDGGLDEPDISLPDPVNATCGENAGDHFRDQHQWPGEFCATGILGGESPAMPSPMESTSWSCQGEQGGEDITCQASRVDACRPERRPPTGWTQITTNCNPQRPELDCTRWGPKGLWNVGFPGGSGLTNRLSSGLGSSPQYLAIELRTFDQLSDAYGRIVMESAGPPIPRRPQQIVTISSCPGDFNEPAIMSDTGCYGRPSAIFPFRWQGPDADPPAAYSSECVLQPDRTYYWNIIPSNSPLGTDPEALEVDPLCLEGLRCGFIYSPDLGYPTTEDIWSEICDPDIDYSWTTCP